MLTKDENLAIMQHVLVERTNKSWDHSSAGRASALQAEGHRFEPYWSHLNADVAQLAEQLICNQQVIGSSPIIGFARNRRAKQLNSVL